MTAASGPPWLAAVVSVAVHGRRWMVAASVAAHGAQRLPVAFAGESLAAVDLVLDPAVLTAHAVAADAVEAVAAVAALCFLLVLDRSSLRACSWQPVALIRGRSRYQRSRNRAGAAC